VRGGRALTAFDFDGPGSADALLVVGGRFEDAGGVAARNVATWDGTQWSALAGGVHAGSAYSEVFALCEFDEDGSGPATPVLIAGGQFSVAGAVVAMNIARWDGAGWAPLGPGITPYPGWVPVRALKVFDADGSGPGLAEVYAAGAMTHAGAVPTSGIARWNGANWSAVGGGLADPPIVYVLGVHDEDGSGPQPARLFAGGEFTLAGGNSVSGIARWNGGVWTSVGGGTDALVNSIGSFDHDANPTTPDALIAGGAFQTASGIPAKRLAAWDGSDWSAFGGGMDSGAYALVQFDDDGAGAAAPALYAGGPFQVAGSISSGRIARWGCGPPEPCYADCNADGALTVADFGCFQTKFVAQDPYADCNQDAALTVADFGCFQTKFVAGCP
jgi:hypothetical protein